MCRTYPRTLLVIIFLTSVASAQELSDAPMQTEYLEMQYSDDSTMTDDYMPDSYMDSPEASEAEIPNDLEPPAANETDDPVELLPPCDPPGDEDENSSRTLSEFGGDFSHHQGNRRLPDAGLFSVLLL